MELFRSMGISASGLTAQRIRMDVIANNIAMPPPGMWRKASAKGSGLAETFAKPGGYAPKVCAWRRSDRTQAPSGMFMNRVIPMPMKTGMLLIPMLTSSGKWLT